MSNCSPSRGCACSHRGPRSGRFSGTIARSTRSGSCHATTSSRSTSLRRSRATAAMCASASSHSRGRDPCAAAHPPRTSTPRSRARRSSLAMRRSSACGPPPRFRSTAGAWRTSRIPARCSSPRSPCSPRRRRAPSRAPSPSSPAFPRSLRCIPRSAWIRRSLLEITPRRSRFLPSGQRWTMPRRVDCRIRRPGVPRTGSRSLPRPPRSMPPPRRPPPRPPPGRPSAWDRKA